MNPYTEVFQLYLRDASPQALSGKELHLKSIARGLRHIGLDLRGTMHALQYFFSGDEHCYHQETVSRNLACSTVRMEGLLDALVICALPAHVKPSTQMNFRVEDAFEHSRLCCIRDQVKNLKSLCESNSNSYADLWTVADFWKRYLPCEPLPKKFANRRIDFQIELGVGKSGPILHDLIIPAFNYACDMVAIIGQELGLEKDDWFVEKIEF